MLINHDEIPERNSTNYPHIFKHLVSGRIKKQIGEAAGLTNFGVNLVKLEPGSWSSIRHWHSHQDEFIYIIAGEITLVTNTGEQILQPGDMAAFPAGEENGHHLMNNSSQSVTYLEIGDRTPGDRVTYPDHDLVAQDRDRGWIFMQKNGELYEE